MAVRHRGASRTRRAKASATLTVATWVGASTSPSSTWSASERGNFFICHWPESARRGSDVAVVTQHWLIGMDDRRGQTAPLRIPKIPSPATTRPRLSAPCRRMSIRPHRGGVGRAPPTASFASSGRPSSPLHAARASRIPTVLPASAPGPDESDPMSTRSTLLTTDFIPDGENFWLGPCSSPIRFPAIDHPIGWS